jgi:hypothetical protein
MRALSENMANSRVAKIEREDGIVEDNVVLIPNRKRRG